MQVNSGGLSGRRSIGIRVKQKKTFPADSIKSCQRPSLTCESKY
jgi:hypothetical protein